MKNLLLVLLASAVALPALAQAPAPAEDWDLTIDPTQQMTMASLDFGDNTLALRCKAGGLDLVLTGTPVTSEPVRAVRVSVGGIADELQIWRTRPDLPVLLAPEPDRLARQLRPGGDLDLRIEPAATGQRPLRFRFTAPPSAAAIDRVLSACGTRLADEWDLRPRVFSNNLILESAAVPRYPPAAVARRLPLASVRVACLVPANGRLNTCRILSEDPQGLGFGRSALDAARGSRVALLQSDTSLVGKVVHYSVRFTPPE